MQPNFLTDSNNTVAGTITENQLLLYAAIAVIGLILLAVIAGFIKKKNSPHIKTDIKEYS